MKKYWLLVLMFLSSCGTYLGSEGVVYFSGPIEEGGNVIVGPEVIMGALGGYGSIIVGAGGIIGLVISAFATKRKKGK